ncbi:sigma-70 family RNA polymerase sigma factor [Actinocrispum sp. NPDC049592]|uniref:RNA polymerase sigma factor n=1 Tax=Actinocrispum sp. NPDC049592 TaxID=3154835 RepID=UPI00343D8CBB
MDPAFVNLYPDLRAQVRFYLRHRFRDLLDVDEIADAVLEKLLVNWPTVRKPLNWAITAARHLALDELRRTPVERIERIEDAMDSVSQWMSSSVDERVNVDAILDALHVLSVSERKAIVLAALGYTNPEIAELLELAPSSIPRCLYAGRKKLEKILRYRRRKSSKSRRSSGRGPGRA